MEMTVSGQTCRTGRGGSSSSRSRSRSRSTRCAKRCPSPPVSSTHHNPSNGHLSLSLSPVHSPNESWSHSTFTHTFAMPDSCPSMAWSVDGMSMQSATACGFSDRADRSSTKYLQQQQQEQQQQEQQRRQQRRRRQSEWEWEKWKQQKTKKRRQRRRRR